MGGCTFKLPSVAIQPIQQYNFVQGQDGLKIALDPFFEEERLKEFFGYDLLSHGILPVLVVAENNNPKSGYLLEKKFFSAVMKVEKETDTKAAAEPAVPPVPGELSTAVAITIGVTGIVAPVFVIVPGLPVLFFLAKQEDDIQKANENLKEKAFVDRTIFNGESHCGFVYFQVKDREAAQEISIISIKAKNITSDKELNFVFQINKGRGK